MKRLLILFLAPLVLLTACATPFISRSAAEVSEPLSAQELEDQKVEGWFLLETAVCVKNTSSETVQIRFGTEKVGYNREEVPWYWNEVRKGAKNKGTLTLQPEKKVCATSDDFPGISGQYILFNVFFQNGAVARMVAENWATLTPAFFPTAEKISDYSIDWSGTTHYAFDERQIMRCQSQEYDFLVYRLKDSKIEKNWLVEIQGPSDPDFWPDEVCVKV